MIESRPRTLSSLKMSWVNKTRFDPLLNWGSVDIFSCRVESTFMEALWLVGRSCIRKTCSFVGDKRPVQSRRGTPPVKGVLVTPSNPVEMPPMIGPVRSIEEEAGVEGVMAGPVDVVGTVIGGGGGGP